MRPYGFGIQRAGTYMVVAHVLLLQELVLRVRLRAQYYARSDLARYKQNKIGIHYMNLRFYQMVQPNCIDTL